MKVKIKRNGVEMEVEETDILATDERLSVPAPAAAIGIDAETQALLTAQAAQRSATARQLTAAESPCAMSACRLAAACWLYPLEASHLPGPSADRVRVAFEKSSTPASPSNPIELENAIHEEQNLLSQLTAAGAIQGPGRISNMVNSADATRGRSV